MSEVMGGPPPVVVLRPLAAAWFAQHPSVIRQLREAAVECRQRGRVQLAEQLEEASSYLRHARDWGAAHGTSVGGSAEVVETEVAPDSESPSSLGSEEVAERLGVSDRWVRMLIDRDELSATKVGGRWVIDRESVDVYQLSRSTT